MTRLRTAEASAFLGVQRATLRRLEERGRLHPARDSRGYRVFSRTELERVKKERRLVPPEFDPETCERRPLSEERSPPRANDGSHAAETDLENERLTLLKRRNALEAKELSERESALAARIERRRLSEHRARFGEARDAVLTLWRSGELKSLYLMSIRQLRDLRTVLAPIEEHVLERMTCYELRKSIEGELVSASDGGPSQVSDGCDEG